MSQHKKQLNERLKKITVKKNKNEVELYHKIIKKRHSFLTLYFNFFAKKISDLIGHATTFIIALLIVIIWGALGHYFHYSDTWQLVINTSTTIVTFLVVFL